MFRSNVSNPAEDFASVIADHESQESPRRYNEGSVRAREAIDAAREAIIVASPEGRAYATFLQRKISERLNVPGVTRKVGA